MFIPVCTSSDGLTSSICWVPFRPQRLTVLCLPFIFSRTLQAKQWWPCWVGQEIELPKVTQVMNDLVAWVVSESVYLLCLLFAPMNAWICIQWIELVLLLLYIFLFETRYIPWCPNWPPPFSFVSAGIDHCLVSSFVCIYVWILCRCGLLYLSLPYSLETVSHYAWI